MYLIKEKKKWTYIYRDLYSRGDLDWVHVRRVRGQLGTATVGYRDSWVQGQTGTDATVGYRDKRVQVVWQTGTGTIGYKCDKLVQGQTGTGVRQTGTGTIGYKCDKRVQRQTGTARIGYKYDELSQRQTGTSSATNGYSDNRVHIILHESLDS